MQKNYNNLIFLLIFILISNSKLYSDFFEIDFSKDEYKIITENPKEKYSYIPDEVKDILKKSAKEEALIKSENFKNLCELSYYAKIARTEILIKCLEDFLSSNKDYKQLDLSEIEEYLEQIKEDEFRIFLTDEDIKKFEAEQNITKGCKKKNHVKVIKKCACFSKNVEFACNVNFKTLSMTQLYLDGLKMPILQIHNTSINNELEYGNIIATSGTNNVTFVVPFNNTPSIIMNGDVTSVSTTGFSVTGLYSGDSVGWIAIASL